MSSKTINANGVKNSSSLAVEAVKNYFNKTAKGLFASKVEKVEIWEMESGVKINIKTKNWWAMIFTDTLETDLLLNGVNFLTSKEMSDISFIVQNKHHIVSVYKNANKQAA